ncbi:MAG: dihydropteroate synthase [Gemmatimonadota bacterium]|nr:dihydropteroate synthase [Gemmatimonadota bacterium]
MSPPPPRMLWQIRGRALALDGRPLVMGIVNVTPDSFSDGGEFLAADAAVAHASRLLAEGADILDVGGQSTRPQGAVPLSSEEELRRVLPVVSALAASQPHAILSVDTVNAEVAEAAIEAGVSIVNDVSGLRLDPAMASLCANTGVGVVVMHSRGGVSSMATYEHADYGGEFLETMLSELRDCVRAVENAGVGREAIAVDPGIGFAKRPEHSLRALACLPRLVDWGYPVLVGASRKRFIGQLTGESRPAHRVFGSVGAAVAAYERGAAMVRVHDVAPTRAALDVAAAIRHAGAAP